MRNDEHGLRAVIETSMVGVCVPTAPHRTNAKWVSGSRISPTKFGFRVKGGCQPGLSL